MTISAADLEKKYAAWFIGMRNTECAKSGILVLFSTEPDDEHVWYEQARKIILKWNDTKTHIADLF